MYSRGNLNNTLDLNICRRKLIKVDLIDISKHVFTQAILFCLDHPLFTPQGVNNVQLIRGDEPIRLLETLRLLSEYVPILLIVDQQVYVFPHECPCFLTRTLVKKKTCHIFPFTLPRKSCQGKLAILNEA